MAMPGVPLVEQATESSVSPFRWRMEMSPKSLFVRSASLVVVLFVGASAIRAQPATQTATEFYMSYRAAFAKAKTIEQMLPLMSKEVRAQVEKTPAAERPKMFEFVKEMSAAMTNVKVVKETKSDAGVTLTVEGMDGKDKMTGQIQILKEGDAWKMGKESWASAK
jgi:hypothetical protein